MKGDARRPQGTKVFLVSDGPRESLPMLATRFMKPLVIVCLPEDVSGHFRSFLISHAEETLVR